MSTWQDANGRTWPINLTLELADHILVVSQIDLLPDDNDYRDVLALCLRPRKLAAVLWECSRKTAEAIGVSRESFSEALDSDSLARGFEAIHKAIETFFEGQPAAARLVKESIVRQAQGIEAGVSVLVETMNSKESEETMQEALLEFRKELQREFKMEIRKGMREALDKSATS